MKGHIGPLLVGLLLVLQPSAAGPAAVAASVPARAQTAPQMSALPPKQALVESELVLEGHRVTTSEVRVWPEEITLAETQGCALPAPTLRSPASDATLDTLVPDFQWSGTGPKYRVQIATVSNFSQMVYDMRWDVGSSADPSIRLNFNLSGNTVYFWRVASRCDDDSLSSYTAPARFVIGDVAGPFPDPPAMVSPPDGATLPLGIVTFTWSNVAGATGWSYRPYFSLQEAQSDDQFREGDGSWGYVFWFNSAAGSYLTPGTYYWRVLAGNAAGWGPLSPIRSFTVAGERAYTVSGFVRLAGGTGMAGIEGVTISGGGRTAISNPDGSYALSGLAPGTYTLTAERPGLSFSPATRSVTVPPDQWECFSGGSSSTARICRPWSNKARRAGWWAQSGPGRAVRADGGLRAGELK